MPFKDSPEGQTNYCTHTKDGSICNKCLGMKSPEEKSQDYMRECLGLKKEDKFDGIVKDVVEKIKNEAKEELKKELLDYAEDERGRFKDRYYIKIEDLITYLNKLK